MKQKQLKLEEQQKTFVCPTCGGKVFQTFHGVTKEGDKCARCFFGREITLDYRRDEGGKR